MTSTGPEWTKSSSQRGNSKVVRVDVWLTKSGYTIERNGSRTFRDFEKGRVLRWMRDDKSAASEPLEAEVDRRRLEFQAGLAMEHAAMDSAAVPPAAILRVETNFGMEKVEGGCRSLLAAKESKEGLAFFVADEEVASATWGERPLEPAWVPSWRRFLVRETRMHPIVRTRVSEADRFPSELMFRWSKGGVRTKMTLRLVAVEDGTASLPVPPAAAHGDDPLGRALAAAESVKTPSKAQAVAKAAQLKKEGGVLDAFLALMAHSTATGDDLTKEMEKFLESAVARNDVQAFLDRIRGADAKESAAAVRDALAGVQAECPRYGWLIPIWRAKACAALEEFDAARDLLLGLLAEHPEVGGAWHDLGWVYERTVDFPNAWRCWDAAFRVAPYHPLGKAVAERRESLRKDCAAFFR